MRNSRKYYRGLVIGVLGIVALTGVTFALTQVSRDASAMVTIEVLTPDGIEVYLDESLNTPVDTIAFQGAEVDVFGTVGGTTAVPLWIVNNSLSPIRLSLSDDFDLADVVFVGEQQPELSSDAVLSVEVDLDFTSGQAGTFNFIVSFNAEGPIPTPTPEPQPVVVAVLNGIGDEITEPFTTTASPWDFVWEQSIDTNITFYLNDPQTGIRIKQIRSFNGTSGTWPVFETVGTFRLEIDANGNSSWQVTITE